MATLPPRFLVRLLVLALAGLVFSGCLGNPRPRNPQPLPLNSERIERLFGSYGVEVLESNGRVRVSNLYSSEPSGRVCRTFAVVLLPPRIDAALEAEHQEIVRGASIGSTFKKAGWLIEKRHRYFGELEVQPEARRLAALMGISLPSRLAVHVYALRVTKSGVSFDYATIVEVHHPEYLGLDDLRSIYPNETRARSQLDGSTRRLMELVSRKMRDTREW